MESSKLLRFLAVAGAIIFSASVEAAQPAAEGQRGQKGGVEAAIPKSPKMPAATDLQSHGVTNDQIDSLSEIMRQAVQQERIAGGSFLVAHKGKVVFREAFGYADLESKRPFTTEELVPIASVSKPFLASVIMVLVEQGKLKLDDPVTQYLPEFKDIRVEGSRSPAQPMTLRHLLSHTAGFWGNKQITPEKMDLIRNFERPLAEAVKGIAEYDLLYEPGTKFTYSGSGYCVAGRVAEVALGQSLEEIAQDALFRPLGLNRTTFLPSKEVRETVPSRYLRQGGKLDKQRSMAEVEDFRFILPGGSLFTTLDDMAVFGQMHLNDGVYNGKRILSEESVTEMRRLQSPDRPKRTYGLGWFRGDVSKSGLGDLVFHSGALGACLRIDRSREAVCVFLVHQSSAQTVDQPNKLFEQVDKMFPVAKSLPDGPSQAKGQASVGEAPAPTGEVAPKWKTTGLQQANSMGAGEAEIPKSGKFCVFVLMGQSNMAGAARAAELEAPYTDKHDRIRIWANGRWEYFVPTQRFGPGVSMARELAELWPDDTIGIIKVASGGTGIRGFEKNWSFERADLTFDGKKGSLYLDLMNAVTEARRISDPEFCGFVWKQGAADGTKKVLADEYFDTFKQLVADLRSDLDTPDLPVFIPSNLSDEDLLKAILAGTNDQDVAKAKDSAGKALENDEDLLGVLLSYLQENGSLKAFGKRRYIGTVITAQNRAGREIPNATTIYPGDLPRIGNGDNHINAEGQLMLGKITASAVEDFYKVKK